MQASIPIRISFSTAEIAGSHAKISKRFESFSSSPSRTPQSLAREELVNTTTAKPTPRGRLHIYGRRLLIRLFPQFTEFAVCSNCSKIGHKRDMYHLDGYGWFCDENAAVDMWQSNQW
jgi:hypothetical protein